MTLDYIKRKGIHLANKFYLCLEESSIQHLLFALLKNPDFMEHCLSSAFVICWVLGNSVKEV